LLTKGLKFVILALSLLPSFLPEEGTVIHVCVCVCVYLLTSVYAHMCVRFSVTYQILILTRCNILAVFLCQSAVYYLQSCNYWSSRF